MSHRGKTSGKVNRTAQEESCFWSFPQQAFPEPNSVSCPRLGRVRDTVMARMASPALMGPQSSGETDLASERTLIILSA
jgi:hypothetical protein